MFVSGSQIGKYSLEKQLGQGGFGVVFSAYDDTLDRTVALKFLRDEHATDREVVHRFLNEARSAAKIVHPGIVTVYECGQLGDNGHAYIAMELLEGETLTSRLHRAGRLAPADVVEVGRQLASALGAAHRAGVVHRDLKPDNIFLVPDPTTHSGERVKILDFGIAKLADQTVSSLQTQSMMVFGTPRYMSPEQCRSAANVDARSDVYTLGCILFELLSGRPPFDGQPGELIAFHLMVEAPTVDEIVPGTPPELVALVARMLQKEPAERPQSMAEVQHALEGCGALVVGPAPTEPPADDTVPFEPVAPPTTTLSSAIVAMPPTPPLTRKSRLPLAVYGGAALIVLAVPVAVWFALHDKRGDDREQVAAEALARPATPSIVPIEPPPPAAPPPPPEPAPVKTVVPRAHPRPAPAKHVEAPKPEPPKPDVDATANPFETPAARGTMSIVSKPSCEIYIDGQSVGLHTPQRGLVLPAGKHRVMLVNDDVGIKDQFTVEIKPGVIERVGKEYKTERDATTNPFAKGSP